MTNPIVGGGWDTQHYAGLLVIGSLGFLWLVRKGFRGLSAGGLNIHVK